MTNYEIYQKIEKKTTELNSLLLEAFVNDMKIEVSAWDRSEMGRRHPRVTVEVAVYVSASSILEK